jgi:hypothetical protein
LPFDRWFSVIHLVSLRIAIQTRSKNFSVSKFRNWKSVNSIFWGNFNCISTNEWLKCAENWWNCFSFKF